MAFLSGFQNIFGKSFWSKTRLESPNPSISFAPPATDDGATIVSEAGYYGTYLDLDGTSRNESALIERYRDIASYPDCENAIDDITTEAIILSDDAPPVKVNLDDTNLPDSIKKKITDEFENVCKLLNFNHRGPDIFRRWYVDGRLYYHKIVDEDHPRQGIKELRYLDPRKTRKVRTVDQKTDGAGNVVYETKQEFYLYTENGATANVGTLKTMSQTLNAGAMQITPESITCVTSGIVDLDKNLVLGYLHKAIRPVNHLRMMEDALVINRVSRAPDRRIFYVDVSGLNKVRAESYLKDLMNRYRNKIVYDAATGEVRDQKKHMALTEDFWMPRTNTGKGTEISTLPGLSSNSSIEDIDYFQKKLYQTLNVPVSRFIADGGGFAGFGRVAEITRDELKFSKFINRLRKRFSELFNDLLRTQLILKGVITVEDWETLKYDIRYTFLDDTSVSEMRSIEALRNKFDLLSQMQQAGVIGTYMSKTTFMHDILKMTDEQIEKEQELMMEELQSDIEKQAQLAQLQAKMGLMPEEPQQ